MELKKAIPYHIHIRPSANNGFIVKVGCGEFVAETVSNLITGISAFLINPDKYVQEYNDKMGGEEVPTETARNEGGNTEGSNLRGRPETVARVPRR